MKVRRPEGMEMLAETYLGFRFSITEDSNSKRMMESLSVKLIWLVNIILAESTITMAKHFKARGLMADREIESALIVISRSVVDRGSSK